MTTISFSVEEDIKKRFDMWSKRNKKSKSKILRDMVLSYEFNDKMDKVHKDMQPVLESLSIESEEQLYEYIESDETYEDRIRHKRLHRSN